MDNSPPTEPEPELTDTEPPAASELSPATIRTDEAAALLDMPVWTEISPEAEEALLPVAMVTAPDAATDTGPLIAETVAPVEPDRVTSPLLADTDTEPPTGPEPAETSTEPP